MSSDLSIAQLDTAVSIQTRLIAEMGMADDDDAEAGSESSEPNRRTSKRPRNKINGSDQKKLESFINAERVSLEVFEEQATEVTELELNKLRSSKEFFDMKKEKQNRIEAWNWQAYERKYGNFL